MIYENRVHAGRELSKELKNLPYLENAIILGLPRGGVVTAYEVAKELHLPMDIISLRKIGAPFHKELAIGAISETGEGYFNYSLIARLNVPKEYIDREVDREKKLAIERVALYRKKRPPLELKEKTVILVDDGLATGATMKAAIKSAQGQNAAKIIVAVPVAPPDTLKEIRKLADKVICPYAPSFFSAVGEFYNSFEETSDGEVIELMQKSERELAEYLKKSHPL